MQLFILTVFAVSMVESQEVRGAKTTHHFHSADDECSCFFQNFVFTFTLSPTYVYISGTSFTGVILRREGRSE